VIRRDGGQDGARALLRLARRRAECLRLIENLPAAVAVWERNVSTPGVPQAYPMSTL
jgi:hypothetical protein